MSLHDKFVWPKPDHEADEILFRNVRTHGCHIVNILDGDPGFSFSIGLYLNYGHPELIIFGLPPDNASGIINDVRNRAAAGHDFGNGAVSDDLLEGGFKVASGNCPTMSTPTISVRRPGSMRRRGSRFHASRSSGRDENGRFPWEEGCLPHVKERQPLFRKMS